MAVEYKLNGRALDGGSNYKRVYDFNRPIDEVLSQTEVEAAAF